MATIRNLSATMIIKAQSHADGMFSVPADAKKFLKIGQDDLISFFVEHENGTLAFSDILKSGSEVYGNKLDELIKKGDEFRLTIAKV